MSEPPVQRPNDDRSPAPSLSTIGPFGVAGCHIGRARWEQRRAGRKRECICDNPGRGSAGAPRASADRVRAIRGTSMGRDASRRACSRDARALDFMKGREWDEVSREQISLERSLIVAASRARKIILRKRKNTFARGRAYGSLAAQAQLCDRQAPRLGLSIVAPAALRQATLQCQGRSPSRCTRIGFDCSFQRVISARSPHTPRTENLERAGARRIARARGSSSVGALHPHPRGHVSC